MFDLELIREIFNNIVWSIDQITLRCEVINSYEEFVTSNEGLEKLDSVCMQLINIGEALKQIDKITKNDLLIKYEEIDWKSAKGMRDIITHHYFDIDAEVVFNVIRTKLPIMKDTINKIVSELENYS
ncbi:MAG: DUF86 domain-containing protein [Ignavibacteriales bacterium]|nr:DUF86 domain-containing protein [Ignavibacteriales bacterium]